MSVFWEGEGERGVNGRKLPAAGAVAGGAVAVAVAVVVEFWIKGPNVPSLSLPSFLRSIPSLPPHSFTPPHTQNTPRRSATRTRRTGTWSTTRPWSGSPTWPPARTGRTLAPATRWIGAWALQSATPSRGPSPMP